jgi:hypothetical protein
MDMYHLEREICRDSVPYRNGTETMAAATKRNFLETIGLSIAVMFCIGNVDSYVMTYCTATSAEDENNAWRSIEDARVTSS